jgi:hypothetical protein
MRSIVLGPSGSGKTILLQNMILDIYEVCFDKIYVFSPSVNLDQTWLPVKEYIKDNEIKTTKIYFSTNLKQETSQIVAYYRARFQMEFVFRDAKQFTGVNTCEARSKEKINFHTNIALTAVNLAKVDWLSNKQNFKKPFSIADYKTQFNNELLINRFIVMFGINPNLTKNKNIINKLMDFGKIVA